MDTSRYSIAAQPRGAAQNDTGIDRATVRCAADSLVVRPEYALILRVDGSLTQFGPEAVESPKLRKDYIQVDIVIPEKRWRVSPARQRRYLAKVVGEALLAILDKAEQKGFATDRPTLLQDYAAVCEEYLNSGSGGASTNC